MEETFNDSISLGDKISYLLTPEYGVDTLIVSLAISIPLIYILGVMWHNWDKRNRGYWGCQRALKVRSVSMLVLALLLTILAGATPYIERSLILLGVAINFILLAFCNFLMSWELKRTTPESAKNDLRSTAEELIHAVTSTGGRGREVGAIYEVENSAPPLIAYELLDERRRQREVSKQQNEELHSKREAGFPTAKTFQGRGILEELNPTDKQ